MKLQLIARRYAEAFLSYAKESVGLERVIGEAMALKKIMQGTPEFMHILIDPGITVKEKFEFIDEIFKDCFSEEFNQFLKLLIEKKRSSIIADVINYLSINYSKGEEIPALVTSAYPLDEKALRAIEEKLEDKLQKNLRFSVKLDKKLIGGIRVEIGSTIIDASLKGRLNAIRGEIKFARG